MDELGLGRVAALAAREIKIVELRKRKLTTKERLVGLNKRKN